MKKILFFIFMLAHFRGHSQNIFDKKHSFIYAKQLACESRFLEAKLALHDSLLIDKINPINSLYLHCLFNLQENELLFKEIRQTISLDSIPSFMLNQIAALCFQLDSSAILNKIWTQLPQELQIRYLLLNSSTDSAQQFLQNHAHTLDTAYFSNLNRQWVQTEKPIEKKFIVASVLIPGSGKIWMGKTYEGMLHLLMVSTHAYLSAYSFNRYGAVSLFGYTNLMMGTVFYGGNIWGTYQSLKRQKSFELQKIKNEIKNNLYPNFYAIGCE
ncbi:MAG: hypothetical protein Q8R57_15825 [Bacteroidota bacterium]|nr:hypothetical protein [Bacteroidota bacterium]